MVKIDQTIEQLIADNKPVKLWLRPWQSFILWFTVTLVATGILASFSSLRSDISVQMHTPLFLGEIITLFALIISTTAAAICLCFPDLRQKPWILYVPLAPLTIYIGLMVYRQIHPEMTVVRDIDIDNGLDCILCITMYAFVPALWMFATFRRHATTYPRLAGAISLLLAASVGVLVLKFLETNDAIPHLIEMHLIPVAIFGIIGAFLGRKFLVW